MPTATHIHRFLITILSTTLHDDENMIMNHFGITVRFSGLPEEMFVTVVSPASLNKNTVTGANCLGNCQELRQLQLQKV